MIVVFIDLDKNKDKGIIRSDLLDDIREHFSERDDKANLKKRLFRSRYVPNRRYAITQAGRFEIGLLPSIIEYINSKKIPFKIILSEEFKKRYKTAYDFKDLDNVHELNISPRYYQSNGVVKAMKHGCGVFLYPTASGKTLFMAMIIWNIMQRKQETKTLVITMTHLVNQTYNDFLEYGIPPSMISMWTGENELKNTPIVICGTNIIYSKIENNELELKKVKLVCLATRKELSNPSGLSQNEIEKKTKILAQSERDYIRIERHIQANKPVHEYLKSINLLLFDEIHSLKTSNEINKITDFIHTKNRFGFTGTLPEKQIDIWNIFGKIGPLLATVSRDELVSQKYITDVDIRILELTYKSMPEYTWLSTDDGDSTSDNTMTVNYERELDFLYISPFRNQIVSKIISNLEKNVLVIVDRLQHGFILQNVLQDVLKNKRVFFIRGEVEEDERKHIKELMEKDDDIICIAMSKIFTTGINIKNLHYIVFASAKQAKVSTIQAIGRGVRMMDGKTRVVIFDLADMLKYGSRHLEKRKTIYDNEGLKYKTIQVKEN